MPAGYGNALSPVVTMACLYQPKLVLKISMSSAKKLQVCCSNRSQLLLHSPIWCRLILLKWPAMCISDQEQRVT